MKSRDRDIDEEQREEKRLAPPWTSTCRPFFPYTNRFNVLGKSYLSFIRSFNRKDYVQLLLLFGISRPLEDMLNYRRRIATVFPLLPKISSFILFLFTKRSSMHAEYQRPFAKFITSTPRERSSSRVKENKCNKLRICYTHISN